MNEERAHGFVRIVKAVSLHVFLWLAAIACISPFVWMVANSGKPRAEVYANTGVVPSRPASTVVVGPGETLRTIAVRELGSMGRIGELRAANGLEVGQEPAAGATLKIPGYESQFEDNYREAWTKGNLGRYLFNSLLYTTLTVLFTLLFASLAAYAFSRIPFPGRTFFYYGFVGSMMIPIPGAFIPLFLLLQSLGLADTRLGLLLPYVNSGLALAIFILKSFFDELPKELEEAALIDGAGPFRIFWTVMLPLAKPAMVTVTVFTALNTWNEFVLALILINDADYMPIQAGLKNFMGPYSADLHVLMAGLTLATVPILAVYMALQRHIIGGLVAGAVKG